MTAEPNIEHLLAQEHARAQPRRRIPVLDAVRREFTCLDEDRYRLTFADYGVTLEVSRLRRERGELFGELSVCCALPGARTYNGALNIADVNLSSVRARADRAKLCAERSNTKEIDWAGIIEEFAQRVLEAERVGQPAIDLRSVTRPNATEAIFEADGFAVPKEHPTVLFGDGGTCKSMLALRFAGRLNEKGLTVAYFDWELGPEDHRDRLERLFGEAMPKILYARCDRPLIYEVDRLKRIVRENDVRYTVYDSVAFACDGPPEAAETAGKYFRAVRQIGGGSLHIAHISKGQNSDQKPFGSTFWHNGARSTWFVQLAEGAGGPDSLQIGLFNRKSNLGRLRPAIGYGIRFDENATLFRRTDVADSPDLAVQLSVRQRMAHALRRGALSIEAVAEEIDATRDTVQRTMRRYRQQFTVLDGGRVGLHEGRGGN